MDFLDIPSRREVRRATRRAEAFVASYFRTLRATLTEPVVFLRAGSVSECVRPQAMAEGPLLVISLALFSILNDLLRAVGVSPNVGGGGPGLRAWVAAYFYVYDALQKQIPGWIDLQTLLTASEFVIALSGVAAVARVTSLSRRTWSREVVRLTYFLPWFLSATLTVSTIERLLAPQFLDHPGLHGLISIALEGLVLAAALVALVVAILRAGSSPTSRRIAFALCCPALAATIFIGLALAEVTVPAAIVFRRVTRPMQRAEQLAKEGRRLDEAERLFQEALTLDPTLYWSGPARLGLAHVHALRMLSAMPVLAYDSDLIRRMGTSAVSDSAMKAALAPLNRYSGPDAVPEFVLLEVREAVLDAGVVFGEIPVTESQLDCALNERDTRVCAVPPTVALRVRESRGSDRRQAMLRLYRELLLASQPDSPSDRRAFAGFLSRLPVSVSWMWSRYEVLNLVRETMSLYEMDLRERFPGPDEFDWRSAVKALRDSGQKFASLSIGDSSLESMDVEVVIFLLRQSYLNYLRAEAERLASRPLAIESAVLREQLARLSALLDDVAREPVYRQRPERDTYGEELAELANRLLG